MLCEGCGKNKATTHIRAVVNGVVSEKNLCNTCAVKEGYTDIKANNLSQMLSSMFGNSLSGLQNKNLVRCNCCGSAFSDIANSGKCGCAQCYETFYEQLLPYIKRVHGSTRHIGKTPCLTVSATKPTNDSLSNLRARLKQLVTEENYEEAAIIRDKIKEMEAQQ